jgi:hypothetical protein
VAGAAPGTAAARGPQRTQFTQRGHTRHGRRDRRRRR